MSKFGTGRRVGLEQAREIAEKVWSKQHLLRDELCMEKEGALTEVIFNETGRLIRGENNLALIRDHLYSM